MTDVDWGVYRKDLIDKIQNSDDIENFVNWSVIQATMFVGETPRTPEEEEVVDFWFGNAPKDPMLGNPPPYKDTTANAIRQLRHLAEIEMSFGKVRDKNSIVEFGGGYGLFAYMCYQVGFRGRYVIYDFEEFGLLQSYYLGTLGLGSVEIVSDISEIAWVQGGFDLFVGLDSITEVPIDERNYYLDILRAREYAIRMSNDARTKSWAKEFTRRKSKYEWWFSNDVVDDYREYLFGSRIPYAGESDFENLTHEVINPYVEDVDWIETLGGDNALGATE